MIRAVRRVRTQDLVVIEPNGRAQQQSLTRWTDEGYGPDYVFRDVPQFDFRPSQRTILASADGQWLAHVVERGAVVVRDAMGRTHRIEEVYQQDIRFSGDGRFFAAVTGNGDKRSLLVLELATG